MKLTADEIMESIIDLGDVAEAMGEDISPEKMLELSAWSNAMSIALGMMNGEVNVPTTVA